MAATPRSPLVPRMPHAEAWAHLLSQTAHRHARLTQMVERQTSAHHAGRLIEVLEAERARIARELHSGAGQPLAGIRMNAELLERWSGLLPEDAAAAVKRLLVLSDAALEQVRSVSHRFHPSSWMTGSLRDALHRLVEDSGIRQSHPKTTVEISVLDPEPEGPARVAIYRATQECISNAIRHSGGESFSLRLKRDNSEWELTISDDGRGADPAFDSGGIGLRSVRELADAADGSVSIGPLRPGQGRPGTLIRIRLPLES